MNREALIEAFNALGIEDMAEVAQLHDLRGDFINLEYKFPSGQSVKIWDDEKMYYGAQICKKNSDRCYGLVADDAHLLVCEYGDGGADAEIVVFKKL